MTKAKRRTGVTKAQWLEAGLEKLRERGISGISVQELARSLGVAKAGFYWHFKDRDDLYHELLAFWAHELTEVVSNNPQVIELEPRDRLIRIAEMILDHDLTRYEIPIRQWALHDEDVARAVRRVDRIRLDLARRTLAEMGFEGDDLEMRTMLFIGYHAMERPIFSGISRKRLRKQIARRVELLTRP
jgi:AcrR family transcriptional regulator